MEDKLKKLNTFKKVSLSPEESGFLRARLSQVVQENVCIPQSAIPSFFYKGVQYGLKLSLSTMFFIVFVGGSVSAIADSALPGDPLYTFKINVNEEIKGIFLTSTEEKVAYQKNRVETRVKEIKTLAESETLTRAKQEKAKEALSTQVEKLSKELTALSDTTPNAALTVTASVEESLKTVRAEISERKLAKEPQVATMMMSVESTTKSNPVDEVLKTVDEAIEKVSKQEVQILGKELDSIAKELESKTSNSIENSENKKQENSETNKENSDKKEIVTPSES